MDEFKDFYSPSEFVNLKLDGMPTTVQGINKKAKDECWPSRRRHGRGGGCEYQPPISVLELIRQKVLTKLINEVVPSTQLAVVSAPVSQPVSLTESAPDAVVSMRGITRRVKDDATLTDKERAQRDAALIICRAIDAAIGAAGCSVRRACQELGVRIADGVANPELIEAAKTMWAKPRADGWQAAKISSRLQRTYPLYLKGCQQGNPALYLIPGKREKTGQKLTDIAAFLAHYCRPSRPPIAEAWRASIPWYEARGLKRPSVDVWTTIASELPVTLKYRGRVTGSEWRGLKPYVDRDVSMFKANDIWVGDGHSFKAKVRHPIHGQAFTPEVTFIIDWVSRKIVGWSVSLSESTVAVSDAFRHAQLNTRARPLVYYSDNGSGQTGKMIDHPITGTLARQGIAHETGIPGNPQGRGIIERLWPSTLIPLARTYPTCTWREADKDAVRQMLADLNRKNPKTAIPSWPQFLDDVAGCVEKYNTQHRHKELKGMTPAQAYQAYLDKDSQVFAPNSNEISQLWMPEEIRKPSRGVIRLFNNEYSNRDLPNVLAEDEEVRVRYDIHNAEEVWVYRLDGSYVCTAKWNGHKQAAFPVSRIEDLREQRVTGKIKRAERDINEAQAELGHVIDMPALKVSQEFQIQGFGPITREQIEAAGREVIEVINQPTPVDTAPVMQIVEEPEVIQKWSVPTEPQARYALWQSYQEKENGGEEIPAESRRWYENYPYSKEFKALSSGSWMVA